MARTNKDKDIPDPLIDEVLETTPPSIDEPIVEEDSEIANDAISDPENEDPNTEVVEQDPEVKVTPLPTPSEDEVEKERRYKAQQAEAQIQFERSRQISQKVEEASGVIIPTEQDLRSYATQEGLEWDELTSTEQLMLKKTYISDKKFSIVEEAVKTSKELDVWAKSVDDFIDSTDSKPEFINLSGNELEFRKFAMKESHRGTPMDILLSAFLHNLPATPPKRGNLFNTGGGGEKVERAEGIIDADLAAKLRISDPREYKRQVKLGKIKLEV